MTTPTPLSDEQRQVRSTWHLWLRSAVLTLVLWLAWLDLAAPPLASKLPEDQAMLGHAAEHQWQFGREFISWWGPWGFLGASVTAGQNTAQAKLAWELGGKLLICGALIGLTLRLSPARQAAFVLIGGALQITSPDTLPLLFLTLAGAVGLGRSRRVALTLLVPLAFLAAFKLSYFTVAAAGIAGAAILWSLRRNFRTAAALVLGYGLAFPAWWMAAGQNPDHIVPHLRRGWELVKGCHDAMAISPAWSVLVCGLACAAFTLVFVFTVRRRHSERAFAATLSLFLATAWFLVWKTSFVRADSAAAGFFGYTLLAVLTLPRLCLPGLSARWFDLAALPALLGLAASSLVPLPEFPGTLIGRAKANFRALPRLLSLPYEWAHTQRAQLAVGALPATQAALEKASVDIVGERPGSLLYEYPSFKPRPIFPGSLATMPRLAWRNLRFYRVGDAPEFVLWKPSVIDGRFPTLEDAHLIASLPASHTLAGQENGHLLLRRARPVAAAPRRELVYEIALKVGDTLTLPNASGHPLWVKIELAPSRLGQLRRLLYQLPKVTLTTVDAEGREGHWRLLPRVAEDGFLLQPLLESSADVVSLFEGRGRTWLHSLRIDIPQEEHEFWHLNVGTIAVRIFALKDISLETPSPGYALVREGVANLAPSRMTLCSPMEFFQVSAGRALLVHAPGELIFDLPENHGQEVSGVIGMREGSYTSETPSDGVEFVAEHITADGGRAEIWRRQLDPLRRPADRGPQAFRLTLRPGTAGGAIALRTEAGAAQNTQWDWAYVAALKFSPSH